MSQVNDTNYVNKVPVAADYFPWVQDADGVMFTATAQQLADLFASLASLSLKVSVLSVNTVLTTQQYVVGNSGSALQFTLPPSSTNTGRGFRIFNKGAGALTIVPNGSDTIKNQASLVLAQYEGAVLQSDGLGMWGVFSA
jgi:hypothetical protein